MNIIIFNFKRFFKLNIKIDRINELRGHMMNPQHTTSHNQVNIPYGYALRMFLGWSILYIGTLVGFIKLLHHHII